MKAEDSEIEKIKKGNYKGIYNQNPEADQHFFDKITGAHFDFNDMVLRLNKIQHQRESTEESSIENNNFNISQNTHTKNKNESLVLAGESTKETRSKSLDKPAKSKLNKNPCFVLESNQKTFDGSEEGENDCILPHIKKTHLASEVVLGSRKEKKEKKPSIYSQYKILNKDTYPYKNIQGAKINSKYLTEALRKQGNELPIKIIKEKPKFKTRNKTYGDIDNAQTQQNDSNCPAMDIIKAYPISNIRKSRNLKSNYTNIANQEARMKNNINSQIRKPSVKPRETANKYIM